MTVTILDQVVNDGLTIEETKILNELSLITPENKEQDYVNRKQMSLIKGEGLQRVAIHSVLSAREVMHKNGVIPALFHAFQFNDVTLMRSLLVNLINNKCKSKAVEIAYYFQHIGGYNCAFDELTGQFNIKRCVKKAGAVPLYESKHGVQFTYDREHCVQAREKQFRYWEIYTVEKPAPSFKLSDIAKATAQAEKLLARLYLAEHAQNSDAIEAHLKDMMSRVLKAAQDPKNIEWVEKYHELKGEKEVDVIVDIPDAIEKDETIVSNIEAAA